MHSWRLNEGKTKTAAKPEDKTRIDNICIKFQDAMDDDFNSPQALGALFELIDVASNFISSDKEDGFKYAKDKLEIFFKIFGLEPPPKKELPQELNGKIRERELARRNKDFSRADAIRKEMESGFNVVVSDTGGGLTVTFIRKQL